MGIREWAKSGSPWIWLTAGTVSVSLVIVFGLVAFIALRGLGQFWPAPVAELEVADSDGGVETVLGEFVESERVPAQVLRDAGIELPEDIDIVERRLVKTGNRDVLGMDFRWIPVPAIRNVRYPEAAVVIEREEWGNFYGYLLGVREQDRAIVSARPLLEEIGERLRRKHAIDDRITVIEKKVIGGINYDLEALRRAERRLDLEARDDAGASASIAGERAALEARYAEVSNELAGLYRDIDRDRISARLPDGREVEIPMAKVVRLYQPNTLSTWQRVRHYGDKLAEFIFDEPREANTEGGIYPAIFGTVLMVIIMSVFVTPLGVIAAVYLREYARQGPMTRLIRIAVNNLAGVPSIVYGVFGLGFFVYFLGSNIDQWFYPEALPAPTFGTPGLLWSSLTLALLTVPVVIVATEEGLTRVPRAIREGSLALGATKAETLLRTVLPMATPAMITGLILAVARAAGEVAPLMMVGVVKLAPSLPLDGNAPFLHLDRKFMHLGFHIYDVGFQSPNVEAARPLVYATALLLVVIILALNLAAIRIRNTLRERYDAAET